MKKNTLVELCVALPEDLYFKVLIYCGTHRITLDKFVESAIMHAMKEEKHENKKNVKVRTAKKSNHR